MTLQNSKFDVVIIGGLGHVGLPLGIVLADTGLQVGLYDVDKSRCAAVEAGQMPFIEYDADSILKRVINKQLHVTDTIESVRNAKYIVITIGTPLDAYLNPKTEVIFQLAEQLSSLLHAGHQVILRSTVYPGTSQKLKEFFGKKGLNIHLSFCPERIAQGYAIRELRRLPQIISGFTEEGIDSATSLFRRLDVPIVTLSVQEAELTKLFSNAWRYIQFATANQFYMIACENGIDFHRIHHAMTNGYERAEDFPKPGFAAGPCLLKDTMQLAAFDQTSFQLGQASMLINEGLPNFIVSNLAKKQSLHNLPVGILGMAFKADIDDTRDSLSYKLRKILSFYGAKVFCSDEYFKDPAFVSKETLLQQAQVVIIGAPHSQYQQLQFSPSQEVIDVWGLFSKK